MQNFFNSHTINPNYFLHPYPAARYKTLKVFLISFLKRQNSIIIRRYASRVTFHGLFPEIWVQFGGEIILLQTHMYIKGKGKVIPLQARCGPEGGYSSMTAAPERGEWSAARPGRTLAWGKTRYPFYRRLGGPQGRCGRAENLVPTGIRSRTIQALVSRYIDWATRPTKQNWYLHKYIPLTLTAF